MFIQVRYLLILLYDSFAFSGKQNASFTEKQTNITTFIKIA